MPSINSIIVVRDKSVQIKLHTYLKKDIEEFVQAMKAACDFYRRKDLSTANSTL